MKYRTTRCMYLANALLFPLSSTYRDVTNWTTRCTYLTNLLLFAVINLQGYKKLDDKLYVPVYVLDQLISICPVINLQGYKKLDDTMYISDQLVAICPAIDIS